MKQPAIVQASREQCPNGYQIACWPASRDFDALQRMTSFGIDSHLEAIRFDYDTDHRGAPRFTFDADSVGVLFRRLTESAHDGDYSLASSIAETLGLEFV